MTREVSGLKWARVLEKGPFKVSRAKSKSQKEGLNYEKALAQALTPCAHGPWFEFEDRNGYGCCQPDILWPWEGGIIVFEAKLSNVDQAYKQLSGLYLPVIALARGKKTSGVIVTKSLHRVRNTNLVVESLPGALALISRGYIPILHWLGTHPLGTPLSHSPAKRVSPRTPLA